MAHAVSLTYARFDHMSASAVAMTTLLHAAVAVALWWISPFNAIDPYEDAIGVTIEREKPAEIPPSQIPMPPPVPEPPIPEPPKPQAASPPPAPAPAPPVRMGLAPVGPDTDVRATPGVEKPSPPKPETPAEEATRPDPPEPEPPQEQQQALAVPPPPPPPPPPSLEEALPPLEAPPPPLTSREIPGPPPPAVKAPPPPQPQPQPPPAQRVQPAPQPAPPPPQQLQSSPLSRLPQRQTPPAQQASRQAPTFQNPADMYGEKRAESEYLWQIARKVSAHQQFVGNATTEAGTVELKLTIARNGRLISVVVSRSSGLPSLDSTSMNIVRGAGPYPPLPATITGAQHTFTLPLYYRRN